MRRVKYWLLPQNIPGKLFEILQGKEEGILRQYKKLSPKIFYFMHKIQIKGNNSNVRKILLPG